jgi:hypothetical protein
MWLLRLLCLFLSISLSGDWILIRITFRALRFNGYLGRVGRESETEGRTPVDTVLPVVSLLYSRSNGFRNSILSFHSVFTEMEGEREREKERKKDI